MRFLKFMLLVLVFVGCLLFFVQNYGALSTTVVLEFDIVALRFASRPLPLYFFVLGGFFLGAFFAVSIFAVDRVRLGLELKKLKSRYATLEDEALALRTLPLNQPQNQPPAAVSETPAAPQAGQ